MLFNYPLKAVFIFICVTSVGASNIDVTYPIIIKNTADGPDSHFGATVSLIKNGIKSSGIIIGAPRANSTLKSHEGIREPGVLWQCSFEAKTQVCRVIDMDLTGNVPDPNRKNVTDRKDEGWLGGAVAHDSKNFVSCANRWNNKFYENKTYQYYMNGACYWRSKDDLFEENLPDPVDDSKLLPLINYDRQNKLDWEQGQAGMSVHIPSKGNEMIIGAPGIDAWRGSVIKYANEYSGNPFRDFLVVNPEKSTDKDTYFGYAVSSGNFLTIDTKPQIQYVTGGPRGNKLNGEVVIFRFPEKESDNWEKLWEVTGKEIGSYFGSSICVADLNGDGLDDLLIGAPKHRIRRSGRTMSVGAISDKLVRNNGYGDEGAVHVYLSTGMTLVLQRLISGSGEAWAQFGTAIAKIGDINGDGYDDIAVGAPYENDKAGVVYIFNGGENGISKIHSQRIFGKTFDLNIRAFGYSFSEGVDIDNNGFNDLAIGAYDTNQVVVLRSMPMITVYAKVYAEIERLSFDSNFESFEVRSCVSYTGENTPEVVEITVRIMIDVQSRPPRFLLQLPRQADKAAEHTYIEEVYKGTESCTKFIAQRVRLLESSGNPVVIKQEISIPKKFQQITQSTSTTYEIIRFGGLVSTKVSGVGIEEFCKDCPILDTTKSKIEELKLPLDVPCGDDGKCVADLRLDVGFKELSPDGTFVIGSSSVLTVELKMTNVAETAISPAVIISWKQRNLKKIPSECQVHHRNDTFWSYKCTYGQLLEEGRFKQTVLEFGMGDLVAGSQDELWLEIEGITASELLKPSKQTIVIPLISQADIQIEGATFTRKFNPSTLIAQTSFKHDFEVTLDGPSPISGAVMDFFIPTSFSTPSLSKTEIRVYEPQPSITQNVIRCYALTGAFSSGQSVTIQDISARKRRIQEPTTLTPTEESFTENNDLMHDDEDKLSEAGLNNLFDRTYRGSDLKISCDLSTVECMKVRCTTDTFTPGTRAFVSIPMSITSISLRSLFSRNKLASLQLVSQGKVSIRGTIEDIQSVSNKPDQADSVTIIELEAYKEVPNWIYGVSIIVGFLVLACVILCLYAGGCFDRKKKPTEDEVDGTTPESLPLQDTALFGNDEMDNYHDQQHSWRQNHNKEESDDDDDYEHP